MPGQGLTEEPVSSLKFIILLGNLRESRQHGLRSTDEKNKDLARSGLGQGSVSVEEFTRECRQGSSYRVVLSLILLLSLHAQPVAGAHLLDGVVNCAHAWTSSVSICSLPCTGLFS